MTKQVLIYIDGDAVSDSLDLLEVAHQIYGNDNNIAIGAYVGDGCETANGLLDELYLLSIGEMSRYDTQTIAAAIAELCEKYHFDAILVPATPFGRMLAPRVAMRLHTGLVADVTEIRRYARGIAFVRPAFSGRMLASVIPVGDAPPMLTVRPDTFTRSNDGHRDTQIHHFRPEQTGQPNVRFIGRRAKEEPGDIRDSEVLVAGGGGVMRDFDLLEQLAEQLHGMVAASRRVVDSGKAPRFIQVGQSGKTVSPRLYIAVGISGSIQHVVGLKNAQYIIAVNPDRRAPICALSDIVVEGNGRDFIQRLLQRITQDRSVG